MENVSLLEKFANPEMLEQLTLGEKFLGSMYIAILGMAITFIALMILWGLIIIMGKVLNTTQPKKKEVNVVKEAAKPALVEKKDEEEPEELVAVITAAIAASLGTSSSNIVVRNIVRVPDTTPAWGRAGRTEQMNRML